MSHDQCIEPPELKPVKLRSKYRCASNAFENVFLLTTGAWGGHHWFGNLLVFSPTPNLYLTQWRPIVNWTFSGKFWWNANHNTKTFLCRCSQNFVFKTSSTLFRPQYIMHTTVRGMTANPWDHIALLLRGHSCVASASPWLWAVMFIATNTQNMQMQLCVPSPSAIHQYICVYICAKHLWIPRKYTMALYIYIHIYILCLPTHTLYT